MLADPDLHRWQCRWRSTSSTRWAVFIIRCSTSVGLPACPTMAMRPLWCNGEAVPSPTCRPQSMWTATELFYPPRMPPRQSKRRSSRWSLAQGGRRPQRFPDAAAAVLLSSALHDREPRRCGGHSWFHPTPPPLDAPHHCSFGTSTLARPRGRLYRIGTSNTECRGGLAEATGEACNCCQGPSVVTVTPSRPRRALSSHLSSALVF